MMTTLTSVLGLVPMALGWGEGAEIRTPMAITVIGGLSFSTLLTLVFVPVMYEILDRKRFAADLRVPTTVEYRLPGGLTDSAPGVQTGD
jgi:HAE1 family hydrophobic/amphiphilic exporter-1